MKQLFHIENPGDISIPQVLSLRLGHKYAGFSITSKTADELFALVYCTTEEWNENELASLLTAYPVLNNSFYQVQIAYDFPESMLVPSTDYGQEEAGALLTSLSGPSAVTITEKVPAWELYNAFAVPKEVRDWIARQFPSAACRHQYSVEIRNITATGAGGSLYIDFRKEDFTLLAEKEGKLLLAQTYEYATPEDVLFYLLRVTQQFSLSQQECQVHVCGLVDRESSLYKEIYQYFIQLDFRNASWQTGEYPAHFFTSLNDLARCAS